MMTPFVVLCLMMCVFGTLARPSILPYPQDVHVTGPDLPLDLKAFSLQLLPSSASSSIIQDALRRFEGMVSLNQGASGPWPPIGGPETVSLCSIHVDFAVEHPTYGVDESYRLQVFGPYGGCILEAKTEFGMMMGLQTLWQMIQTGDGGKARIAQARIYDAPRFSHRGVMIDTARHFYSLKSIETFLDAMAMSKFNVLHWHLVDDQSFPFVSKAFPRLAQEGAFAFPSHTYSRSDVESVIRYAAARGIRVMPEFDSPGHTRSWGKGYPDLLTKCYSGSSPNGQVGPLDPSNNATYSFLHTLWGEVGSVFQDQFVHIGGDEVSFECWKTNPAVQKFLKDKGFTTYNQVESFLIQHVLKTVRNLSPSRAAMVWEEVFTNGNKLDSNTIVEVWKGHDFVWKETMAKVTAAGYQGVLSAPWYLNYHRATVEDWDTYWLVDPTNFTGGAPSRVIGGEACLWSEYIDATVLMSRAWPRAAAVGERLWSSEKLLDLSDAAERIHDFRCRMLVRGFSAEPPSGPSWCPIEWQG